MWTAIKALFITILLCVLVANIAAVIKAACQQPSMWYAIGAFLLIWALTAYWVRKDRQS